MEELREDIADNGKLDCLFQTPHYHGRYESNAERNIRIKASWNSDCGFDATYDWKKEFFHHFNLTHLVDVRGNDYHHPEYDDPKQADLCEMVRTLVHKGHFDPNVNLMNLSQNPDVINKIRCAVFDSDLDNYDIPGICAVNPKSSFSRHNFIIFLGGKTMGLFDSVKCETMGSDLGAAKVKEIATLEVCQPNSKPFYSPMLDYNGSFKYLKPDYMKLTLDSTLSGDKTIDLDVKSDFVTLKERQNYLVIVTANLQFNKDTNAQVDYTTGMILSKYNRIGKELGHIDDSANIGAGYALSTISQLFVYTYQEYLDFKNENEDGIDGNNDYRIVPKMFVNSTVEMDYAKHPYSFLYFAAEVIKNNFERYLPDENAYTILKQTNNSKILIDKSKGKFALVIWHLSGKTGEGSMGKTIDMDFSDDMQKMHITLGSEPYFNFWHTKVLNTEDALFIKPKLSLEKEDSIQIDDQAPFKINNFNVLYTSKVFVDQYKQLTTLPSLKDSCEENYSKCEGDCLEDLCCMWNNMADFKIKHFSNEEVLVFYAVTLQVQNPNHSMATFRMLANGDKVLQQSYCSTGGLSTIYCSTFFKINLVNENTNISFQYTGDLNYEFTNTSNNYLQFRVVKIDKE